MGAARPGASACSAAGFRRAAAARPFFILRTLTASKPRNTLRGLEVQVPIEQRAQLDAGNYFVSDLVGCEVWEAGAASALGSVRDVEFPGRRAFAGGRHERGRSPGAARRRILRSH